MALSFPSIGEPFHIKGGISIAGVVTPDDTVFVIEETVYFLNEEGRSDIKFRISVGKGVYANGLWECTEDQLLVVSDRIVFSSSAPVESDSDKLERFGREVSGVVPELNKLVGLFEDYKEGEAVPSLYTLSTLKHCVDKLVGLTEDV